MIRALRHVHSQAIDYRNAPIAQLDRALPSEGRGRWFESSWVHHSFQRFLEHDTHKKTPRGASF